MSERTRIREALEEDIERGVVRGDERLPTDVELAARFGVHRHTVRRALEDLKAQGLVRSERGRGTFVVKDAIAYRLGAQTRFEENLAAHQLAASRRVLRTATFGAPPEIAEHLGVSTGSQVLMVSLLGEAERTPAHLFTIWFSLERTPQVAKVFEALPRDTALHFSIADVMSKAGVSEFRRRNGRIICRLPSNDEARQLRTSLNDPVFELSILNVADAGEPIYFGVTIYPGSRTAFTFDFPVDAKGATSNDLA